MKKLIALAFIIASLLITPQLALANYGYFGAPGVPSTQLIINKLVQNPINSVFVDNLSTSDPRFLPGQRVTFRIDVKNNGQTDLTNVTVSDRLPDQVTFVSGPVNASGNMVTRNIDSLKVGEVKSFTVVASVKSADQLPAGQVVCQSNFSQASVNGASAQDSASFCIETRILGVVSELPITGPEMAAVVLIGSTLLLLASVLLIKMSGFKIG